MASWNYAFFFPPSNLELNAEMAVTALAQDGFEILNPVRRLVPIDDKGHLGEFGECVQLRPPYLQDLRDRLSKGEQIFAELSKHDGASNIVTTFACSFAIRTANPHFSIGWHKQLFSRLPEDVQRMYWMLIRDVAKSGNAAYVLHVEEASDTFEDRFVEIDGKRMIDAHNQSNHGIWAVWIDRSLGAECPNGIVYDTASNLGDDFFQYTVH